MAASFTFTLTPEKQQSYSRIAWLVIILHIITFIVLAATRYAPNSALPWVGIAIAVSYFTLFFAAKKNVVLLQFMQVPVYLLAVWWLVAGVYLMALLVLLFAIFATLAKQKIQVVFTAEAILYNSFPVRHIGWSSLNNVILKDGLLTLDFANNKIMQRLIEETGVNEPAFNAFANTQLQNSKAQKNI